MSALLRFNNFQEFQNVNLRGTRIWITPASSSSTTTNMSLTNGNGKNEATTLFSPLWLVYNVLAISQDFHL